MPLIKWNSFELQVSSIIFYADIRLIELRAEIYAGILMVKAFLSPPAEKLERKEILQRQLCTERKNHEQSFAVRGF